MGKSEKVSNSTMDNKKENNKEENKQQSKSNDKKESRVEDGEANAPKTLPNPQNSLKMGKFHRYTGGIFKPKKRVATNKKKIRDLQRLLSKENVNEDLRKAKQKDLKQFKKIERDRGEAEKFELKYKKIKFFEKKKVIKKLEQFKKQIVECQDKEGKAQLEREKKEYRNLLLYIDNYPPHKKYISLFPKEETDIGKAARQVMMDKILKTINAKNSVREKEMLKMDESGDEDQEVLIEKKTKRLEKNDAFFTVEEDLQANRFKVSIKPSKKLLVQRNGKVVDADTGALIPGMNDDMEAPQQGKFGQKPPRRDFKDNNGYQPREQNQQQNNRYENSNTGYKTNRTFDNKPQQEPRQDHYKPIYQHQERQQQTSSYQQQYEPKQQQPPQKDEQQQPLPHQWQQQLKIKANAYRVKNVDMEQNRTHIKF